MLKQKLSEAYKFMKQFTLGGINMLENGFREMVNGKELINRKSGRNVRLLLYLYDF